MNKLIPESDKIILMKQLHKWTWSNSVPDEELSKILKIKKVQIVSAWWKHDTYPSVLLMKRIRRLLMTRIKCIDGVRYV